MSSTQRASESDLVECTTPSGARYYLTYSASGMPVRIHTTVRECADSGDETSMLTADHRFLVVGAVWRDDISEQAPCLVGRWLSDGHGEIETYPMPSEAFHVRWELWA